MDDESFRTVSYRPSTTACSTCGADARQQTLMRGPTGYVWRCLRCNNQTSDSLPFDPRAVPEGKDQMLSAIETLAVYVPILGPIDKELVYETVRPYFKAGWCVRDILHAINYLPTGETHMGQGAAWVRGEDQDRTLRRLQRRLRMWRFSDRFDGEDIMRGPYSATQSAMRQAAEAQHAQAAARAAEWHERAEAAEQARESGAREVARRQAAIAASLARQARRHAEQRELERRAAEATRARSASAVWMAQHASPKQPDRHG